MKILLGLLAALVLLPLVGGAVATVLIARSIEARFPPAGRFVEVEGGRVHLLDTGPPPGDSRGTVVLIHGASGNLHDMMFAIGDRLRSRYRVVAVDRPGHGWSDRIHGTRAAIPARQAAILAGALRRIGVSNAVVVGHSLGGAVAPNFALDHRDVAGGLVLLSAVTHPWPGGEISWYYRAAGTALGWLMTRTVATPVGYAMVDDAIPSVFRPQPPIPGYVEAARIPLVLRPRTSPRSTPPWRPRAPATPRSGCPSR